MTEPKSDAAASKAVNDVIQNYLRAVKDCDEPTLRGLFHDKANIQHYYVKGDDIKTIALEDFVASIGTLHARYENAEEKAREIEILMADHIASVRVAFSFVMGPKTLDGQDLFNLAFCKGEWKIVHKSYYL